MGSVRPTTTCAGRSRLGVRLCSSPPARGRSADSVAVVTFLRRILGEPAASRMARIRTGGLSPPPAAIKSVSQRGAFPRGGGVRTVAPASKTAPRMDRRPDPVTLPGPGRPGRRSRRRGAAASPRIPSGPPPASRRPPSLPPRPWPLRPWVSGFSVSACWFRIGTGRKPNGNARKRTSAGRKPRKTGIPSRWRPLPSSSAERPRRLRKPAPRSAPPSSARAPDQRRRRQSQRRGARTIPAPARRRPSPVEDGQPARTSAAPMTWFEHI